MPALLASCSCSSRVLGRHTPRGRPRVASARGTRRRMPVGSALTFRAPERAWGTPGGPRAEPEAHRADSGPEQTTRSPEHAKGTEGHRGGRRQGPGQGPGQPPAQESGGVPGRRPPVRQRGAHVTPPNAFPPSCSFSCRIGKKFKVCKQPATCIFIDRPGGFLIFSNNNFTLKKDFILEAPKNLGVGRNRMGSEQGPPRSRGRSGLAQTVRPQGTRMPRPDRATAGPDPWHRHLHSLV